jgi:RNA polymerase sigma-70 factor, ECF subfamily
MQGIPEEVVSEVYGQLRRIAASFLRTERPGHTLQPSAIINEAYLRLAGQQTLTFADHNHFVRLAARAMRQVLVDYGKARRAAKRQPEGVLADYSDTLQPPAAGTIEDYLAIDGALGRLEEMDPRQAEIIQLRFFAGLSVPETAEVMGISEKTVKREWQVARVWLRGELAPVGETFV